MCARFVVSRMEDVKINRGGQSDTGFVPSENVKLKKANSIEELLSNCPKNQIIGDNLIRAWAKINSPKYKKIVCTISGGSDSDVMLDIIWRCDKDNKVEYVWFDTGIEYQATKEHLKYLGEKYGIKILTYKAKKPIPTCCKEYGQPFISKRVSDMIYRLQSHNFQWEDEPLEVLEYKYPKCKAALQWWTNGFQSDQFNIRRNKLLKEFIIQNHPDFKISDKCCMYAKKNVIHNLQTPLSILVSIFAFRSGYSSFAQPKEYRTALFHPRIFRARSSSVIEGVNVRLTAQFLMTSSLFFQ